MKHSILILALIATFGLAGCGGAKTVKLPAGSTPHAVAASLQNRGAGFATGDIVRKLKTLGAFAAQR